MKDYVVISFISHNWEMFQRVPHYTGLSKYKKVICVELPLTIFDLIFRPVRIWKQRSKIKNRLRQINENLYVFTPIAVVPFGLSYLSNILSKMNRVFISRQVEKLMQDLQIKRYITIVHDPYLSCLVDILDPLARIYEIADEECTSEDHADLDKHDLTTKALQTEERKIFDKVDIVFVTAIKLFERKRQYNSNIFYIPNGVDLEHFWHYKKKELLDIMPIPRPRVGYVGHINTFINFEWVDYCVAKHPDWSFVFIGIIDNKKTLSGDPHYLRFKKRKNVFMLGWKKYEDLPVYMQEVDVFLLPRRDCDYSQNSNPNKLYQYFSTGKPIVSTRFSSVEPFEGPVFVADNKLEFSGYLEKAISENDDIKKEQRMKIARQFDLKLRAQEKIDIINNYLQANI